MKAIQQRRYGTSAQLSIINADRPSPSPGDVLVRVHAAGVNMADWHLMTGEPWIMRLALGIRGPRERTCGSDVAGVVVAVGEGVTEFSVGDAVFGTARGSFAEYAIANPQDLAVKPSGTGFSEAAASVMAGYTALRAVRDTADVQPGQRILVLGAGGGVGSHAVQIAVADGAHVTGVCSTAKVPLVQGLGATQVIDYTSEPVSGTYDAIIDTGGNRPIWALRKLLTDTGIAVIVGGEGGNRFVGPTKRMITVMVASQKRGKRFVPLLANGRQSDLRALAELIERGKLTVPLGARFSLGEVPRAIDELASGRIAGKAVIEVGSASS